MIGMRTNKEIVRIQTENLVGMLLTIYIYIHIITRNFWENTSMDKGLRIKDGCV